MLPANWRFLILKMMFFPPCDIINTVGFHENITEIPPKSNGCKFLRLLLNLRGRDFSTPDPGDTRRKHS